MKDLDLTKTLKKYKSGWVAIDEKNQKVIAHAEDFDAITKKLGKDESIFIMPASEEYFGFIT